MEFCSVLRYSGIPCFVTIAVTVYVLCIIMGMVIEGSSEEFIKMHGVIDRAHARSNVAQKMILNVCAHTVYPLKSRLGL